MNTKAYNEGLKRYKPRADSLHYSPYTIEDLAYIEFKKGWIGMNQKGVKRRSDHSLRSTS